MSLQGIFDSHAHYFDKRFEKEYEGGAERLLAEIMPTPVSHILNVGTDPHNSEIAVRQALDHAGMYAAVGIHPGDCHYLSNREAAMEELCTLLGTDEERRRKKIVAIGEIGLDYYFEKYGEIPMDRALEQWYFDRQMELAEKLDLPVIIHDREAHGDCFETVLRYPKVRGVFHSFSGSAEMARELTRRGWYISFSGTLTFKNAERVRAAARAVPRDRLLVETDAPYLAPHPMRGRLNHSGLLVHLLNMLAELWECTPAEAACVTAQNAKKLFGIV